MLEYFKNKDVKIWLFGSRTRKDNTFSSDIDIAIEGTNIQYDIAFLREVLEESNLPYKVDIVDFLKGRSDLRESILKEGVKWKG